jgi:hypothetical protein
MQHGTAALLLAHLNPVTNTHIHIISYLDSVYNTVYIFPVRFVERDREINTKSFPFSYDLRRAMIESVYRNARRIVVLPDYTFYAPFLRYLPPLISPYSWILRNNIIRNVSERKLVTYTGDLVERIALKLYHLNPVKANRMEVSASSIKQMMYAQAREEKNPKFNGQENYEKWQKNVPLEVLQIIKDNWALVRRFASSQDRTLKILGMKFPIQGFL